jgi:hypothetical protein
MEEGRHPAAGQPVEVVRRISVYLRTASVNAFSLPVEEAEPRITVRVLGAMVGTQVECWERIAQTLTRKAVEEARLQLAAHKELTVLTIRDILQ